ncbi:MAG TPA: hypothetical protein VN648_20840 [Candidatus Methylomirabilis sp.]|nr:hypothetical protein [Candidatus Methylomirabilis sp.]
MFVPPVIVSYLIIRYADLRSYRDSRFGRYVKQYMTQVMQVVRLAGYAAAALGAWFHLPWLIAVGILVIVYGWTSGLIREKLKVWES